MSNIMTKQEIISFMEKSLSFKRYDKLALKVIGTLSSHRLITLMNKDFLAEYNDKDKDNSVLEEISNDLIYNIEEAIEEAQDMINCHIVKANEELEEKGFIPKRVSYEYDNDLEANLEKELYLEVSQITEDMKIYIKDIVSDISIDTRE